MATRLTRPADDADPFRPSPHDHHDAPYSAAEQAADEAFNRRLRASEAAEAAAAEARRRAALLCPQDPPPGTPPDRFEDHEIVDLAPGEQAAVIAEVEGLPRYDGWTVERRLLFLDRLFEHGTLTSAARAAKVSRTSVYRLRARAPAFAAAMDRALAATAARLADAVFERAIHGHEVPIYQRGELVGTRTVHHDQLACYLLRVRDPLNYAPIDELERWKKQRALEAEATERAALPGPEWPIARPPNDSPTPSPLSPL